MKTKFYFFSLFAVIIGFAKAQNVYIPDANFKAYLVSNYAINTNHDNEIQVSEAVAYTEYIRCTNKNISDLKGIEAFVNIYMLECQNNNLTSLDLSGNIALRVLNCSYNQLTNLNVSENTALEVLSCYNNLLTSIDVSKSTALTFLSSYNNQLTTLDVSKNTALSTLQTHNNQLTSLDVSKNIALNVLLCYENQLTSLDMSKNTVIERLGCNNNQLTNLDLSKNIVLQELYCNDNLFTTLDLSKNTALKFLYCYNNQLINIDVSKNVNLIRFSCYQNQLKTLDVSNNIALRSLYCSQNQLTNLDVSKNTDLVTLWCNNNQLTSLNVKNGNNSNVYEYYYSDETDSGIGFDARNNPNLTCIQVDNSSASYMATWQKDPTASFNEDCLLSVTDVNKTKVQVYPNPVKDMLNFSEEVSNVKITDVSGRTVKEISAKGKSVNVAGLAKGVYMVSAVTKSGEMVNKKIVKE